MSKRRRHPGSQRFRGSMAGLYAPLPTLRRRPRGRPRTARGRCGSLLLHRSGPFTTYSLPVPRRTHSRSSYQRIPDGYSRLFRNAHHPGHCAGAACGGLNPDPAIRVRGADPHLLCGKAASSRFPTSEPPLRAVVAHNRRRNRRREREKPRHVRLCANASENGSCRCWRAAGSPLPERR